MKSIFAFDFDGVIADSAGGWAFFCRKAWKTVKSTAPPSPASMVKHRAYIKNARESFGLMILLNNGSKISRETVRKETEKNKEDAQKFFQAFFTEKENFIRHDMKKFCRLYRPYEFVVRAIKRISKNSGVYIVTNNKKSTITPVLKNGRLRIENGKILDNTLSEDKKQLLEIVKEREDVSGDQVVFIDDSLEHLKLVSETGARLVLASWGFVIKKDLQEAKKLGITIATKDNVDYLLEKFNTAVE